MEQIIAKLSVMRFSSCTKVHVELYNRGAVRQPPPGGAAAVSPSVQVKCPGAVLGGRTTVASAPVTMSLWPPSKEEFIMIIQL